MLRKSVVIMTLLVFGACGGSSETDPSAVDETPTEATAEGETDEVAIQRYCKAVDGANQRGEEVFAEVDQDDEKALQEAEREMLEFLEATFPRGNELPEEIEEDFETFLAGFEYRVETGAPEAKEHHQAAERRLLEWEEEHCQN